MLRLLSVSGRLRLRRRIYLLGSLLSIFWGRPVPIKIARWLSISLEMASFVREARIVRAAGLSRTDRPSR